MKQSLKVAVHPSRAQANCSPEMRLAELDKALTSIASSLDLGVCPELYLSGYGAGEQHHALAEPVGGPFANALAARAQNHGPCIVYGYPQAAGRAVYNSAAAIGADGALLANNRKTILPNAYERTWFTPGDSVKFFSLGGWKIALIVCYEVEFSREIPDQGADLIVMPTALTENWSIVPHQVVTTRAFENGVYLAYANHAAKENDLAYLGASCILNPHGKDLARAGAAEELIEAELLASLQAARTLLPYLADCKRVAKLRGFYIGGNLFMDRLSRRAKTYVSIVLAHAVLGSRNRAKAGFDLSLSDRRARRWVATRHFQHAMPEQDREADQSVCDRKQNRELLLSPTRICLSRRHKHLIARKETDEI
ncbi:hypothetical protein NKJ93_30400 [Mesorhizobium sp. M0028]|uniref:nitrilase-related carbon-nitrogen hydrolase n=1 Tax=Mesorhizobium sp. M0028 TaxID=2956849 RepID=UPI0033397B06